MGPEELGEVENDHEAGEVEDKPVQLESHELTRSSTAAPVLLPTVGQQATITSIENATQQVLLFSSVDSVGYDPQVRIEKLFGWPQVEDILSSHVFGLMPIINP